MITGGRGVTLPTLSRRHRAAARHAEPRRVRLRRRRSLRGQPRCPPRPELARCQAARCGRMVREGVPPHIGHPEGTGAYPFPTCGDGPTRPVVVRVARLEAAEHMLGAVGGPRRQRCLILPADRMMRSTSVGNPGGSRRRRRDGPTIPAPGRDGHLHPPDASGDRRAASSPRGEAVAAARRSWGSTTGQPVRAPVTGSAGSSYANTSQASSGFPSRSTKRK